MNTDGLSVYIYFLLYICIFSLTCRSRSDSSIAEHKWHNFGLSYEFVFFIKKKENNTEKSYLHC